MNWKKWLGIIVVILLIAFIGFAVFSDDEQDTAISVRAGEVTTEDIEEVISTTGVIEAADSQEVYGQGPVTEVMVESGDEVSEGDALASYLEGEDVEANMDGTVTDLNIEAGEIDNNIQLGQPSIIIEDLENLHVVIGLSKADADSVEVDQNVELTYTDNTYSGTVSEIASIATEGETSAMAPGSGDSSTLDAIVTFDEQPEEIIPGFDIDLEITVDSSEGATVVPIEALNYDADGNPYVYIVENGVANQQEIETGIQSNVVIEVTEGLSEGDEVILSPDEDIEDGVEIEPESSEEENE